MKMRRFTCQRCHGLLDVPPNFDWDEDVCEECIEVDKATNDDHRNHKIRTDCSEPKTQDSTSQENGPSDHNSFTSEASELCFEGDDCVKVNFPIIGDEDELTDGQGDYEEESFSEKEKPIENTKTYSMVSSAEGSPPPRSGAAPHAINPSSVVPTFPEDDKSKVSYRSKVRLGIPTNRVPPGIPTAAWNTGGSVKKDSAIYGSTGQTHREYREYSDRRQGQESSIGQPPVTTHIRTYDNHTFGQQSSAQSKTPSKTQPPPPSAQSGSPNTSRNISSSNKQTSATKGLHAPSTAASAHAWGVRDEYEMSNKTPSSNSGASATMGGFESDLELARRMQLREEAIERDARYAQTVASLSMAPAAAVSVAAPLHVIPLPACVDSDLNLARRIQKQEEELERDARYAQRVADEMAAAEAAEMELFRRQEAQAAEDRRIAREMDKAMYFTCVTCMDDRVIMEDIFDLGHDDHKMCKECGHGYISNAVNDRHVPVKCPFLNCEHELAEAKCLEVLDEEQQELWFSLSKRPHADPGFRQCPVPNCSGFDLMDTPEECDARCYVCQHHWCSACQVDMETSQHQGITCEQYQQWKRENDTGDDAMEAFLRQELQDEDGTDRMRRCPNCRMAYMKDRASMHATCMAQGGGCGAHFCFRCADFSADSAQAIYQHLGTCRGYQGVGQGA